MKIAVLGAGNGGCAAAADLTLRGFEVALYNYSEKSLEAIRRNGGAIRYSGVLGAGECRLSLVTTDMGKAMAGAGLVMMSIPGPGHALYAKQMAPHLTPDSVVLMNPGHSGGALHFAAALRAEGAPAGFGLGETNTLSYISRISEPGSVYVSSSDKPVMLAAFPSVDTDRVVKAVHTFYPKMLPVENVLISSFANLNAMFHPPGMVCNAGWIEHARGDFRFYYDGITPAVGNVIDAMDRERLAVGRAFGLDLDSFVHAFYMAGSTTREADASNSAYRACQESDANRFIKAPPQLDHRYMHEDIGSGLVPMACLAAAAGVATPIMDSQINLAGCLMQRDYWQEGVNLEKMGLAGKNRDEILAFVRTGYGK